LHQVQKQKAPKAAAVLAFPGLVEQKRLEEEDGSSWRQGLVWAMVKMAAV
jgi:hypothetical protein